MTKGQLIKAARKRAGMTQKELGEKLGIAYQTIAQWENDLRNPKPETIQRIAKALDIQPWELDKNANDMLNIAVALAQLNGLRDIVDKNDNISAYELKSAISEIRTSDGYNGYIASLFRVMRKLYTLEEPGDIAAELLFLFDQLNPDGQQKAVERVEELTEIPRYRAETTTATDNPSSED